MSVFDRRCDQQIKRVVIRVESFQRSRTDGKVASGARGDLVIGMS